MNPIEQAVAVYGLQSQKIKAIEEMAELIQAISKDLNGKTNIQNIIEEIVDVQIMLKQLEIIYKIDKQKLNDMADEKLTRLGNRIEKHILNQSK